MLTQKEGQVNQIQSLVLEPDFVDIGQVYVAKVVFEAPWNYVPESPVVTECAGIQQHAESVCLRSGISWGTCQWTLLVPLQVLSPDDLKDGSVEICFSNGSNRIVKTL